MIRSIVRQSPKFTGEEEVIVVPLFEGETRLSGSARKLDVLCRSAISDALRNNHFKSGAGETLLLRLSVPKGPAYVLLLGLGLRKEFDHEQSADAGGAASKLLKRHRFSSAHVLFHDTIENIVDEYLHSFIKGFSLAQYSFAIKAKKSKSITVKKLVFMTDASSAAETIRHCKVVVEYTEKVRDLVNQPANQMTPARMAEEVSSFAKKAGVRCRILKPKDIAKLGMGAVIDVGKGSHHEQRFIEMHYNKGKSKLPKVCLVGKAVTFDSGGISIKPWSNMNEMKGDMAGGAVVACSIAAAAKLKLPVEIVGLIPCVENLLDGLSFRPGDIVTTYSGKTIEILSTDAEGRVILADALAYAGEFSPDVIIDYATLTGAVVVALGTRIAGIMGNSQSNMDLLLRAGEQSGEPVWQLPLDRRFSEMVKGDISDFKNYSGRDGSSITAAALLGEFVDETPWVHVDIAGTFWSEKGSVPYHSKGATGYGVDLTLRYLERIAGS